MKYESDILEAIHENALAEFRLGILSEAEMREYDEGCLSSETTSNHRFGDDLEHEEIAHPIGANIKHAELVTA